MTKRHQVVLDDEDRDRVRFEWPDPTPVEVPLHLRGQRPPSLQEEIRRLMSIMSQEASAEGQESFEEADDFDVDEDPDVFDSGYELKELENEVPIPAPTGIKPPTSSQEIQGKVPGPDPAPGTGVAPPAPPVKSTNT